jgi:hypothetical protein
LARRDGGWGRRDNAFDLPRRSELAVDIIITIVEPATILISFECDTAITTVSIERVGTR